jgi:acyl-CoA synthetase (AMP-forming)/AMP-acid ligase II
MAAAIDVPERFNAAAYFLDRHVAEGRGARTAFRFGGRDVQSEQRVLLALPDRPEFAEAFWGAMKIGAVPVPVSDGLPAEELAFLLQDSRARAVIASEAAAAEILRIRARCPALESVIVVGGRRRGALEYERLLEKASPEDTQSRSEERSNRRSAPSTCRSRRYMVATANSMVGRSAWISSKIRSASRRSGTSTDAAPTSAGK